MELPSFKKIVGSSKEKLTELMAAPRARRLRAQAESEMSDLDIEIITLEGEVEESIVSEESYKNFKFKDLLDKLDRLDLLARRKKQYGKVLKQLFPEDE